MNDNPEWTDKDFARARPAAEVIEAAALLVKPTSKTLISLRLDPDVVAAFKAAGPGWQTRINDALRRAMVEQRKPQPD